MSGQGSFNGHIGGFPVAHLSDHDDIRIGAKKGSHGRREREPDLGKHLDLSESFLGDLNRIFGRPYFSFVGVQMMKQGMEGRRFSRSGGTDAEDDSMRLLDGLQQRSQGG